LVRELPTHTPLPLSNHSSNIILQSLKYLSAEILGIDKKIPAQAGITTKNVKPIRII